MRTRNLALLVSLVALVACAGEPAPVQTPTTAASTTVVPTSSASAAPAASSAVPAPAFTPTTAAMKAEATKVLNVIARDEVEAYERENLTSDLKPMPQSMCPAAHAVPASLDALRAGPYTPKTADFANDPGWKCLRFELVADMPFQYEVVIEKDVAHIFARRPDVELELVAKVEKKRVVIASTPIERAK